MRNRTSAVLGGVATVAGGALLLQWLHRSATGYAPADAAYEVHGGPSTLPMLVLFAAIAVTGVCLASVGWWRPFFVAVAVAYGVALVAGDIGPLLGAVPRRMSSGAMAAIEAALLAAPTWVVAERGRAKARPLPIPSRLALPRREREPKALPSPKHA